MKINSIQFLRAIAALLVAYHHSIQLQMNFGKSAQQNFYHLWNFGSIGVDIFFVVSGFIISHANANSSGTRQGVNFLIKRFVRINPVYYISSFILLMVLVIDVWVTKGIHRVSLDKIFNSFADTILIIPISGQVTDYQPIQVAGWTLGFEWLFYLIFFILIVFSTKNKFLWLSAIIILLVGFGHMFRFTDYRFIFSTNSILLEFLLGIAIYSWYIKIKSVPAYIPIALLLIGFTAFLYLIIYGFDNVWSYVMVLTNQLSLKRFLLFGIPSAAIVAGCLLLEKGLKFQWLWNSKLTNTLGDVSYSLYLVNPIIYASLSILYKKAGFFMHPDVSIIIQLLVAIMASIVFFKIVEKPFINLGKGIILSKNHFRPIVKNIVGT